MMDAQRLLEMVNDHPIMKYSLEQRIDEIKGELEAIPLDQKEARISIFFYGKPVIGSEGLDAQFAGKVLSPFQNMVKTDFAQRAHGRVGGRGPAKKNNEAQLYITALPRGSFGIELAKLENYSLFDEHELADTLVHVTNLIEASAKSDADFAVALEDAPSRTIRNLGEFLKVVSDEEAGVTIESGGTRCKLSVEDARIAYDRVSFTKTDEETLSYEGTLRGIMLDSWRFDFTTSQAEKFSGRISDDLTENQVKSFFSYIDELCVGTFEQSKVIFKNGQERKRYTLISIADR